MDKDNLNRSPFNSAKRSVISNEDLVVIAANPLGSGPPGAGVVSAAGSACNSVRREQRNGTPKPTSLPLVPVMGPSESQLSIQVASSSPVSNNSERLNFNVNNEGAAQRCSNTEPRRLAAIRQKCCSVRVRKLACGLVMTAAMASSWVSATHFIKRTYLYRRNASVHLNGTDRALVNVSIDVIRRGSASTTNNLTNAVFYAPFFTTWFCTSWIILFFPLYLCTRCLLRTEKTTLNSIYKESVRNFQERGLTLSKFLTRSGILCGLWVVTNYMYVHALRILDATDVMALYSSSVSFVYLLSWVILHHQFVGVRIVAVILCNTGIALLAYMDGLTKTPTLGGVILGAAASAGSAVFRVLFKKLIGDTSFTQVALFFSVISLFNIVFLWLIPLTLYLTGLEVIKWPLLPWIDLLAGAGLSLVTNLLGNFGIAITYELFITLGLVVAVPVSAVIDNEYNHVNFAGMKLSGNILIVIGFLLVLFPDNWPNLLTRLIRLRRQHPVDELVGHDACGGRSRLRSASGLIR